MHWRSGTLCHVLARRLTDAAIAAGHPADRAACQEAAECAAEMAALLRTMTRRAVFGDFLDLARRQLDASPRAVTPAGGEDVQGACDSMARLVVVLARYVDDITPPGAPADGIPADAQPGWDRARAEARQALATMAAILHANDHAQ